MFTLFIIIVTAYLIYACLKKEDKQQIQKRKPESFYDQHPELNTPISYKSKKLNSLELALNLGIGKKESLDFFRFENMHIYIKMQDGKIFNAHLRSIDATFTVFAGENCKCELICGNQKVEIITIWHLFTDEEWYSMFNLFTYCGITKNVEEYAALYERQTSKFCKTSKHVLTALKIIKHFT